MEKLMEIIDRLIMSGLSETEAVCLVGSFLETEANSLLLDLDPRQCPTEDSKCMFS